jgi:hypothetical protein
MALPEGYHAMPPRLRHPSSSSRPRRWAGRLALLASLAAIAIAAVGPAQAEAAPLPEQGLYEQCAPRTNTCGERLQMMADAGFTHVLNYTSWFGSAEEIRRYADQAAAAGIKLIWPLNDHAWRDGTDLIDHYRYLGPSCLCATNAAFKQFAIGLVKDHPATWGFYVGDELEPTAQNITQATTLAQEVKQLAPNKPTMYVALPRGGGLTEQLGPFVSTADFAGADYYPVGMDDNIANMANIAQTTQQLTSQQGRQSVLVLQAFSWSQYRTDLPSRFPTRDEMLEMRNLAIRHGEPDVLLWYAFNDVMDSDSPSSNWENVREAAFAPYIQLDGVRRCAGKSARFAVNVRAASPVRKVRVIVDGRRVPRAQKRLSRIVVRGLKPGRHKIRAVAVDGKGKRSQASQRFRRCG